MKLKVSRIVLADGNAACPNCEGLLSPELDIKYISTLGSDKPRKAFGKCSRCGTDIEVEFDEAGS